MTLSLTCLTARKVVNRNGLGADGKEVTVTLICQTFTDKLAFQARKCRGSMFCYPFLNLAEETRVDSESSSVGMYFQKNIVY